MPSYNWSTWLSVEGKLPATRSGISFTLSAIIDSSFKIQDVYCSKHKICAWNILQIIDDRSPYY